jgi:hypothetical protein
VREAGERDVMRETSGVDSRLVKPFLTVGLVIVFDGESGARYCSLPWGHLPAYVAERLLSTEQDLQQRKA